MPNLQFDATCESSPVDVLLARIRANLWRNARRACVGILPFCQKANTADVLSPRPFARRHLAANSDVVDRGDPGPATRSKMALWEHGVCLCLDLGEERGTFGRPEPTTGARRPHAFESTSRSEDARRWFRPRPRAIPSSSLERRLGQPASRWTSAHVRRFNVSDTGATPRPVSRSRSIAADIGSYYSPPYTPKNGSRAQSHAWIDNGGIPATAPDVMKLAVDEFGQNFARSIPLESGSRSRARDPVR